MHWFWISHQLEGACITINQVDLHLQGVDLHSPYPVPASLGLHRSETFVDVKTGGNNNLYALTSSGVLVYIQDAGSRIIDKTVNVQVNLQS